MNDIVKIILAIVFVYLPTIGLALRFINAKIDAWQSQSKIANNDVLMERIDRAQEIVTDIVTQVNQCYVDSVKIAGNFTKESQVEAKNKAIDLAETLISTTLKDSIVSVYGDYSTWIDTTIEATVNRLKGEM